MSKPDFDNNNNSCNDEVDVGGGSVPNGIVDDEILKGNSSALVFVCLPEKDQLELIEKASNEVVNHHQIQPGTTTTSVITVIEKLPDENEEDFGLRRIVKLLSNLPLNSRKMLWDKAHSRLDQLFPVSGEVHVQCSFKMKTIDLRQPGDSGGDSGDGRGRGGGGGVGGATQGGEGETEKRRLLCFSCFQ
ncbi:hypothetical protein LOK49_LG15G01819 [Camellia lanceoleosa]|uniref:Uncharacterized protein n=1 Tax=Camellia lanceoleosa TaxID=1840588 RepID=A0ACC0F7G1_9ERIC|nr:hypothetical protein LOK49_LG15G01819 [Camellia lanceoleosa]